MDEENLERRMTELSGLDLRKALCEALGWKAHNTDDPKLHFFHAPACPERWITNGCRYEMHVRLENLPALESDPGVFWPEFEKWCSDLDVTWECSYDADGYFFYVRIARDPDSADGDIEAHDRGPDMLPTACRAWLAVLRAMQPKTKP